MAIYSLVMLMQAGKLFPQSRNPPGPLKRGALLFDIHQDRRTRHLDNSAQYRVVQRYDGPLQARSVCRNIPHNSNE